MPRETLENARRSLKNPLIVAFCASAAAFPLACTADQTKSLGESTPPESGPAAPAVAQTDDPAALPAAIENPSELVLTGRLIDLDPAIRWACSYSGMVVESVEKPSDSNRTYRITDSRNTPMRLELACDDFSRGHFEQKSIRATASFGRIADEQRQTKLLRKIQHRLDQLAERKR